MNSKKYFSFFQLGVRQKVLLVLLSVLLFSLSISGWLALKQEKQNTLKEINQRGSDISRFVAKSLAFSVVGYDYHTIQLLLDEITFSEDISYAKVVNVKGGSMAESGELITAHESTQVMFNQDIRLEDEIVGNLTLGLSTEGTIQRLESQKYELVKREAFIIMLIALGEFLALSFLIIRPVSIMSDSLIKSVDESGRIVGEVPVISKDEFGNLAEQFNSLSSQLNDANSRLQSRVDLADKKLIHTNRLLVSQSDELRIINDEFKKMTVTDSLTGLNNRRRFEDLMETELMMSLRHGDVNSILVIDIDFFKKINDNFGHPCGDIVLKMVANTLKSSLRKTDILCRIGGEEFVALCKRADKNAALDVAEKLRRAIEQESVLFGDDKVNVTISIGVATSADMQPPQNSESLYRQADIAVYHSKDNGRNTITHYDNIIVSNGNMAKKSI